MKICFISTDFAPNVGGIADLSKNVCNELSKRGHDVCVLTNTSRKPGDIKDSYRFKVKRIFPPYPNRSAKTPTGFLHHYAWSRQTIQSVHKFINEQPFDIIIAGNYNSALMDGFFNETKIPYALFLHGGELGNLIKSPCFWRKKNFKRIINGAATVFCNSNYTNGLLHRTTKSSPISTVTGCGFSSNRLKAMPDKSVVRKELGWGDEKIVLTVCRMVKQKGVDTVIRAWPRVQRQCKDIRFVAAGSGVDLEYFKQIAKKLEVDQNIDFLGYVDDHFKEKLYCASDLFVMPSKPGSNGGVEGFGISFLEAGSHGLAVVGSTVGGIQDAVINGSTGLLVEPDDPASLSSAIVTLLLDPALRKKMGKSAQERIRNYFDWPIIADLIEKQLKNAISMPEKGV